MGLINERDEKRRLIKATAHDVAFTGHRRVDPADVPAIEAGFNRLEREWDLGWPLFLHNGCAQGFDTLAYKRFWPHELMHTVPHPVYRSQLVALLDALSITEDFWRIDQNPCHVCYDGEVYLGAGRLMQRNKHMVDSADEVICYWNGVEKGGTWDTIKYARKVGKPVRDIREV